MFNADHVGCLLAVVGFTLCYCCCEGLGGREKSEVEDAGGRP